MLLHFSQETLQRWGAPQAHPQDGAALWLPGRLLVQLRMVPAVGFFLWLVSSSLLSARKYHRTSKYAPTASAPATDDCINPPRPERDGVHYLRCWMDAVQQRV